MKSKIGKKKPTTTDSQLLEMLNCFLVLIIGRFKALW